VHKSVMEELKRIIDDSEITKEDDALWPPPDRVGRQVSALLTLLCTSYKEEEDCCSMGGGVPTELGIPCSRESLIPCWCWGWNSGPLDGQSVFLTEPTSQSFITILITKKVQDNSTLCATYSCIPDFCSLCFSCLV
jgi:hypothetical protein